MTILLYFDGACEPVNPGGTMSYGWCLEFEGKVFDSDCGISGGPSPDSTNNVAEYLAVIAGLEAALEGQIKYLHVMGDSRLVINQLEGHWGCKSARLRPLYEKAWDLSKEFERIGFEWIPRERNEEADELTKQAYMIADRPGRGPRTLGKAPGFKLGSTVVLKQQRGSAKDAAQ